MNYPNATRLELPILQELAATGGFEDIQFLYKRLIDYFPQISSELVNSDDHSWRRLVQRAGRTLDEKREIERNRGHWTITVRGRKRVSEESFSLSLQEKIEPIKSGFSHEDIQQMIMDIGRVLKFYAQAEFEYYDVIWKASKDSPRISHVFEVQRKGNIDAALAKLKRAYDAQRSKPFLILTSERDTNRAHASLSQAQTGAFHEIGRVTTILSFEQLGRLHQALLPIEDLLSTIIER
jgi:hypothetical protein